MSNAHCKGPLPSLYNAEQIEQYLDLISLSRQLLDGPRDIHLLTTLHALQVATIPYENLSLHYNPNHANDIDPQALFTKFVTNKRGRGGYCMETAIFWREILRGLGFHTYTSAARIRLRYDGVPKGDFVGWRHVTNIVTLPTGKYSSDVGFGGDGETIPLPLLPAPHPIFRNLGSQEIRLIQAPMPGALYPEHNVFWQYQYRNAADREWNTYYVFSEMEAFDADFLILNYYTSVCPDSFQVKGLLVVKFLLSGKGREVAGNHKGAKSDVVEGVDGEHAATEGHYAEEVYEGSGGAGLIAGKLMLAGPVLKRNMGGKTETLKVCASEQERVQVLERYFGITLTDEERNGIAGFGTEIQ